MCEALVVVVDQVHEDPYMDVGRYKRGDVVVVVEDGHEWAPGEFVGRFRVVKMPGVPVRDMLAFLAPELHDDPSRPSRMLQRRAFKLDVDALGIHPEDDAIPEQVHEDQRRIGKEFDRQLAEFHAPHHAAAKQLRDKWKTEHRAAQVRLADVAKAGAAAVEAHLRKKGAFPALPVYHLPEFPGATLPERAAEAKVWRDQKTVRLEMLSEQIHAHRLRKPKRQDDPNAMGEDA